LPGKSSKFQNKRTGDIVKKLLKITGSALLLVALLSVSLTSAVFADENTIDMVVSPNVLNLESNGGSISVHTDIGYVAPADATLEVNGTPVDTIYTFTDSCGNLVVKADIAAVKEMVVAGEDAVFVLTCNYNGGIYTGTDTVPVIRVVPQKP
jgi:hypothetical protein